MLFSTGIGIKLSYNLNFHQTFKPERDHVSSLLSIQDLSATKEELSHKFGIPTGTKSGKVEVNLLYAQAAGFLKFSKNNGFFEVTRTRLGDIVFKNDNYLEHNMTQLLIHYMFCSNNSLLALWHLLFTSYRSISNIFQIQDFQEFAAKKFQNKNIKTAPLIGTYISKENPIITLDLLKKKGKIDYELGKVEILTNYIIPYTYFLFRELITKDNKRKDFMLADLLNSGFNKIFGWDSHQLRLLLELIESNNHITLNKQFDNYHIHLNVEIDSLLQDFY